MIQERSEKSGIGFGADIKSKTEDKRLTEFLNDLEPEDLVKYGLIPEFVGRMPVIATLEELDEDALVTILTEPKNSLVKQYQKLFELEGVELEIRDDALSAIAKRALARKPVLAACGPFWKKPFWRPCLNCLRWIMFPASPWMPTSLSPARSRSSCTKKLKEASLASPPDFPRLS